MRINVNDCRQLPALTFLTLNHRISKLLLLLFFVMAFATESRAQKATCSALNVSESSPCQNGVITYTATLEGAADGKAITWNLISNTSGAFFVSSGNAVFSTTAVNGANSISVNVGPNTGRFTVSISINENGPNMGKCTASAQVKSCL